jgi:hypothetical protein
VVMVVSVMPHQPIHTFLHSPWCLERKGEEKKRKENRRGKRRS